MVFGQSLRLGGELCRRGHYYYHVRLGVGVVVLVGYVVDVFGLWEGCPGKNRPAPGCIVAHGYEVEAHRTAAQRGYRYRVLSLQIVHCVFA